MRKRFEAQYTLGCTPIEKIEIPVKSRDEFPAFLRAMKHIYCNKELSEQIYSLLEEKICSNKKSTGRPGMHLWTIFVLAGARLCLNTDYDRLHYLANNDILLRQMLGVHDGMVRGRDFERQNIIDNVQLLDDDTLRAINLVIVEAGHQVVKKKETEALRIKIDSFVTEANVHFPTDYNLLWDSGRKCLDVLERLTECESYNCCLDLDETKVWRKQLKNKMLTLSRVLAKKNVRKEKNQKKKNQKKNYQTCVRKATCEYLSIARIMSGILNKIIRIVPSTIEENILIEGMKYFIQMLDKHIDLVDRRLLKGETIPQEEKIFSIFEPWVEWICKGKAKKPVELGKRTNVASDQWHFIVDWWVADHQQDNQLLIPTVERIKKHFTVSACSSDKGYYSKTDVELIEQSDIKAYIPKKGKCSSAQLQKESDPAFIEARHKHSAVESNIESPPISHFFKIPFSPNFVQISELILNTQR